MPTRNLAKASKEFFLRGGYESANPGAVVGRIWYVNTILGSNSGNQGRASGTSAFATLAKALSMVDSCDIISVSGVVREQLVSPVGVFDVKITGAGTRPRQATSGGVPTGGGATWMPPASGAAAATPLIRLIEQGWHIENIQLVPHTSSACITIERADASPERDGSHAVIRGCRLVGGTTANGILFLNGGYNCLIEDNDFE